MPVALRVWLGVPRGGSNEAVVLRGGTRVMCGLRLPIAVGSSSATSLPPSGSDQSATNRVYHRLETVVGAELLVHVVEVIAKRLR